MNKPCAQCPWRRENHGRRHFGGFYTKRNLRRLWAQIRRGGGMQSCHITDPQGHPDHVRAGAKPSEDAKPEECYGSLILVQRELENLTAAGTNEVTPESFDAYNARGGDGLTKRGIAYYAIARAFDPPIGGGLMMQVTAEQLASDEFARAPR